MYGSLIEIGILLNNSIQTHLVYSHFIGDDQFVGVNQHQVGLDGTTHVLYIYVLYSYEGPGEKFSAVSLFDSKASSGGLS